MRMLGDMNCIIDFRKIINGICQLLLNIDIKKIKCGKFTTGWILEQIL